MKRKFIIVNTVGQLSIFGGITGPILRPFYCDVDEIRTMIAMRISVQEIANKDGQPILRNGQYIKIDLDLNNYDKTNYIPDSQPRRNNYNNQNNRNNNFKNNQKNNNQKQQPQQQEQPKVEKVVEEKTNNK